MNLERETGWCGMPTSEGGRYTSEEKERLSHGFRQHAGCEHESNVLGWVNFSSENKWYLASIPCGML